MLPQSMDAIHTDFSSAAYCPWVGIARYPKIMGTAIGELSLATGNEVICSADAVT